ncbi:MAG: DMSO reductase, partial [Gallionella sp.]|nr:DMSO reductase [Gallionella sp.]
MGGSFNTREFFHNKSGQFLSRVKVSFLLLAFVMPLLLLLFDLSYSSVLSLGVAFVAQFAGLLAERWYFFAEARHPQNLYYQGVS